MWAISEVSLPNRPDPAKSKSPHPRPQICLSSTIRICQLGKNRLLREVLEYQPNDKVARKFSGVAAHPSHVAGPHLGNPRVFKVRPNVELLAFYRDRLQFEVRPAQQRARAYEFARRKIFRCEVAPVNRIERVEERQVRAGNLYVHQIV